MDTQLEPLIKVTELYHYYLLGTQHPLVLFLLAQNLRGRGLSHFRL